MSEGSNNRGDSSLHEFQKADAVGTVHVAYKAEIDAFRSDRTAMGTNEVQVSTRETESVDAKSLQLRNEVLVNESAINHCYHA